MKWIRRGLIAGLLLAVLLFLTGVYLLTTESGTQWTINRLAENMPGDIRIETSEGTFWRGLHIPDLLYRDSDQEVDARNIELRIDWRSALAGRLEFKLLDVESVRYQDLHPEKTRSKVFSVDLQAPKIPVRIKNSRIGQLELNGNGAPFEAHEITMLDAVLQNDSLRLESISAKTPELALTVTALRADIEGDIALRAVVDWITTDNVWSGHGKVRGTLALLNFEQELTGPYPFTAEGTAALLGRVEPEFNAMISWERWTIGDVHLDEGIVELRGAIDDYAADYELIVELTGNRFVQVTGNARGSTTSLSEFDARLESRAGSAGVNGTLAWSPALSGNANITISDFDPALADTRLSGKLDAVARLIVTGSDDIEVEVSSASGLLNGANMEASGTLQWSPQAVQCESCSLSLGANQITLDGSTQAERMLLDISVQAPDLEDIWPGLDGGLQLKGRLDGTPTRLRFTGDIHGQQLLYEDWFVGDLVVASRSSGIDGLDLTLQAENLLAGTNKLGTLEAVARGSMEQLDLEATWNFGELRANASARLEYTGQELLGVVKQAHISEPNTGDWVLAGPFGFRATSNGIKTDSHEWTSPGGSLTVSQLSRDAEHMEIVANLDGLPLRMANPLLPAGYQLSGTANADIDIAQTSGAWTGNIDWQQHDTLLSILSDHGEITEIQVPRADARISLQGGGADISAALAIEQGVTGELGMRLDQLTAESAVTAELRITGSEWDWVSAVIPAVDNFAGTITARIGASGDLRSPDFSGKLEWRDGKFFVPALNAPMESITLDISGTPDGAAVISGSLDAGEGKLLLSGRIDKPLSVDRSVSLDLKGQNAMLLNWPEYQLWATPELSILGDEDGWILSGTMNVPRASVTVQELPTEATSPSPDVIVLDAPQTTVKPTLYSGDIGLKLGDQVHVKAFGLDTRISGDLQLRIPATGPLRADGMLTLADGKFEAFGQKLAIERGTLTFAGPLDNPFVDVRAQRVIETSGKTVIAGIHLRGRARSLASSIYSEPAMSEADAFSYLAFGRPLNQTTATEGNELANAAIALGMGQANRITTQIGRKIGLDELVISADGDNATALIAGKQINQRLYSRYSYGVFSRIGTLLLRYRMSQRMILEAGAGETQTIDFLYTVEKASLKKGH